MWLPQVHEIYICVSTSSKNDWWHCSSVLVVCLGEWILLQSQYPLGGTGSQEAGFYLGGWGGDQGMFASSLPPSPPFQQDMFQVNFALLIIILGMSSQNWSIFQKFLPTREPSICDMYSLMSWWSRITYNLDSSLKGLASVWDDFVWESPPWLFLHMEERFCVCVPSLHNSSSTCRREVEEAVGVHGMAFPQTFGR